MEVNLFELLKTLATVLHETKEEAKARGLTIGAREYYNGRIETLEKILVVLNRQNSEGQIDMQKLKTELIIQTVTLKDIPSRKRVSPIKDRIKEAALQLEQAFKEAKRKKMSTNDMPVIKITGTHWNYFYQVIGHLQEEKQISSDIKPIQRGGENYLIHQ